MKDKIFGGILVAIVLWAFLANALAAYGVQAWFIW